jgi:DNA-binding CsgD family transcriptional regulator
MASSHSGRGVGAQFAVDRRSRPSNDCLADKHSAPVSEVILDGRRYRLVPVDENPVLGRRVNTSLLTGRELQIVSLVAEGRINKQIAVDLHISEWTVSTHLRRIFVKLSVDTRAAMVAKCPQALGRPLNG